MFFDLKPYSHQKEILEDLRLEREGYDCYKNFVVASTGTGKTYLLNRLKEKGMETVDLEGCAKHRGSTLGSVGLGEQNSQPDIIKSIGD